MVTKWRVEMTSVVPHFFMFFFVVLTSIEVCVADCDNLQDTCPTASQQKTVFINGLSCKNPAEIAPHDFKNMDFSKAGSTDNIVRSSMKIISASEFPGLNTLGLSIGRIDIGVDGMVQPHHHPRATEMIFVVDGVLIAGFLDTNNNKLFQKLLNGGDVFMFPKGLFHFCLNRGRGVAIILSVFNSQSPGMGSVAPPPLDTAIDSLHKLIPLSDSQIHDFDNFTWTGSDSISSHLQLHMTS